MNQVEFYGLKLSAVHSPFQSPCRVQVLYLFHLICSLSLFRFRQWPFATVGLAKPPFDSGFQYNLNNEFLFLQNKKGWNASYIHEVLNELWESMGMSILCNFT